MSTTASRSQRPTDIVHRFNANPILTPEDIRPSTPQMRVECVLNPGAFRFAGKTWLLLRVAERPAQPDGKTALSVIDNGAVKILEFDHSDASLDRSDPRWIVLGDERYLSTLSHLRLVSSTDGVHFREEPGFAPLIAEGALESYGIEDCRVTQIDATYYLTYSAVSPGGVGIGLRTTTDWRRFTSHGMILPPNNKDCAIFNEKIRDRYCALHRPSGVDCGGNYIWLAESSDMLNWGSHRCVAHTRPRMWDSARVGAGAAPIRTAAGWLEIYHGADARHRYCLGALLLDLNEPWKVLARSREPIMEPTADYERKGFFGDVVFTNGHVVDGDIVTVYYGGSDNTVCGARFSIAEVLRSL